MGRMLECFSQIFEYMGSLIRHLRLSFDRPFGAPQDIVSSGSHFVRTFGRTRDRLEFNYGDDRPRQCDSEVVRRHSGWHRFPLPTWCTLSWQQSNVDTDIDHCLTSKQQPQAIGKEGGKQAVLLLRCLAD